MGMSAIGEDRPAADRGGMAGRVPAVLLSHPTGNQNVRNALLGLVEEGMLGEFWTAIAWDAGSRWNRWLPAGLRMQLARRAFEEAPREHIRCVPLREMARLAVRFTPLERMLSARERPFSVIGMYRHFDARVARGVAEAGVDAVYAYEGGALKTFREAQRRGVRRIYDLTSGYWYWERERMREEGERHPEWASVLPKVADSERHLQEKDEELALADVVHVASRHVERTLRGVVAAEKIRVIPYGAPEPRRRPPAARRNKGPLRVLFVGMLHQRKGIGYLLEAMEMLGGDAELTLIGKRFAANAFVDEGCRRHRWLETMPHQEVLEAMQQADVLALPSLSEAFGLVVTEALACGLPVIVTPNVGASDLVSDGREGFVVPAGSAEAIAERLKELAADRERLAEMSRHAQARAAARSWESYRRELAESVKAETWQ